MDYIGIRLLDDLEFESRHGQGIFLSFKRPDRLGCPTKLTTPYVLEPFPGRLSGWGRETDHLPPSSAHINNECS